MLNLWQLHFLIVTLSSIVIVKSTLTPKSPKGGTDSKLKVEKGPQNYSVFEKKLVTETPSSKDILIYNNGYSKNTKDYKFQGLVLGYVTPVSFELLMCLKMFRLFVVLVE